MLGSAVGLAGRCLQQSSRSRLGPARLPHYPVTFQRRYLAWSWYTGGLDFNNTVPVPNATGTYSVPVSASTTHLNFFGRSANITGLAALRSRHLQRRRNGGGPPFHLSFRIGGSLVSFLGQPAGRPCNGSAAVCEVEAEEDPRSQLEGGRSYWTIRSHKLINWGINRWAFKPEVGYSQRFSKSWVIDAYGGVWLYTTNPQFYNIPYPVPQTQAPIGSFEGHLSYDFKRLLFTGKLHGWASIDGNYWWGGIASIFGIPNPKTDQSSSRIGGNHLSSLCQAPVDKGRAQRRYL